MHFKINNLIILTEEGLKRYQKRNNEIGDIYRILWINEETLTVFVYSLKQNDKSNYIFERKYYRNATESEVKKYRIKKMFVK
jgi:hypothetical protein